MSTSTVKDLMTYYPLYVYEDDDLLKVLEHMKRFNVDTITIINKNFSLLSHLSQKHIQDYLKTNFSVFGNTVKFLKNVKVKDIMKKDTLPLTFYPATKTEDAFNLMKSLKRKYAPVVETPWEKKVIGFLWLSESRK